MVKSKIDNEFLSGQSRELVSNLIKFTKEEAAAQMKPIVPFNKVHV